MLIGSQLNVLHGNTIEK